MQRNNEKTGEGAARQRLSDESDSQDTMLHADEEGAARQSDESDFQETRGSRDMIFVMIISDNKQCIDVRSIKK